MSTPKQRHGQIKTALMAEAKAQGMAANDMYNRFFRELFLAELMAREDGWVLKGGTNLYCRIPGARHTQDLDLYRQDDPTAYRQAAAALAQRMDGVKIGPYRFQITTPRESTLSGTIDNAQLTVQVFYGVGELSHFHIDVSGDLQVPAVTDTITVTRSDSLDLAFAQREFTIRSYPIENQVADKVCAMFELHGADQRPSTRYRDLYDIALIALELSLDAADLSAAVSTQQQVRNLTLPTQVQLPAPEWEAGYAKLVAVSPQLREEIADVWSAVEVAGLLLDPILGAAENVPSGMWSPTLRTWGT